MDVTIYEVLVFGMLKFSNLCEEMSNHTSQHLLTHSLRLIRFSSEFLPKTLSLIKYLQGAHRLPSPSTYQVPSDGHRNLPFLSIPRLPTPRTLPYLTAVYSQSDQFLLELEMREVPDAPRINRSVDCSASPGPASE